MSWGREKCSMVIINKIDELTLLSRKLVANSIFQNPEVRISLFAQLFDRILAKAGFNNEENEDFLNFDDFNEDDYGDYRVEKMFENYEKLKEFYDEVSDELRGSDQFVSYELMNRCGMEPKTNEIRRVLFTHQADINKGWLGVKGCLEIVNKESHKPNSIGKCANVVLCDDGIAHGAAQLLVGNPFREYLFNCYRIDRCCIRKN